MNKQFDRYASLLFFLIGSGFMWESKKISESAYGSVVGPNIFPFALGLILVILSLRLFYETFQYKNEENENATLDYKRFFIILIAALLYALLLEDIGYVISTFIFLIIGFQTMEKGGWLKTLLISGLFSFGVYYLFVVVLKGSMPGFPAWLGW